MSFLRLSLTRAELKCFFNFSKTRPSYSYGFSTTTKQSYLKVNASRLNERIHETCKWGAHISWGSKPTETGMRRLALSDDDKLVRDWFVSTTSKLGCKVTVDAMGNIFAIRPGKKEGAPTCIGSHLDTQPSGGRYDGILGVHAGIEALSVLHENNIETEYPVGVINWTNEEGARFPSSMVSSGVWAGKIPIETAYALEDVDGSGATQKGELERIGYLGSVPCSWKSNPIAAHFELHIEQGPILESENRKIGIVQGAQAYKWFNIEVHGNACHTGTTPFYARADPILAASKMIVLSHRIAGKAGALASTGVFNLIPGSVNTVPEAVFFSLDVRASDTVIVDKVEEEIRKGFQQIASGEDVEGLDSDFVKGNPCKVSIINTTTSPAVKFHRDCLDSITKATDQILGSEAASLRKEMTSGAGHDTVCTSYVCPSAMVFIPCRDGVSHNPKEYSTPEDCALGTQVLLQSVLNYDISRNN